MAAPIVIPAHIADTCTAFELDVLARAVADLASPLTAEEHGWGECAVRLHAEGQKG